MSDENTELSKILQALSDTNKSITSLKSVVEKQAQTIEELRAAPSTTSRKKPKKTVEVDDEDLSDSEEIQQMKEQLQKSIELNNRFHSEQRKEKVNKATKDGLIARGVDPKKVEHAWAFIKDKVSMDKAGSIKMVDTNGVENNLEEALDHFCDSADGNFYKAPVDVNGAGTSSIPGSSPTRSNNQGFGPSKPGEVLSDSQFNKWIEQSLNIN